EAEPVRFDISRPCRDGVALRSGEGRARKNEDAFLVRSRALPFVDRGRGHKWIEIRVARAAANRNLVCRKNVRLAPFSFRLVRVEPPRIRPKLEQATVDQLPIVFPRVRVERIV